MQTAEFALVFGAGVASFASPCVLPLVPVLLSVSTGLEVSELGDRRRGSSATVVRGTGLFIAGFSAVFVALGLSATAVGAALSQRQGSITRVAGVVVVVLAVLLLVGTSERGLLLSREWRFHPRAERHTVWAAPVTGAAFAFGWTPCIGPVLGSVLAIAAEQGGMLRGAGLLGAYSAGLAVPLMVTGLAFHRVVAPLRWTRRHTRALTRLTAGVLAGYGVLLVSDQLAWLTRSLQVALTGAG